MDVDVIVTMAFFLCDLHNDIKQLHSKQLSTHTFPKLFFVYRGQGLSHCDFQKLMESEGGLLSFNSFLSTTWDYQIATFYCESFLSEPNMIGVLFKITVDPAIPSAPYANIGKFSYYQAEEEILFSMHTIFRISQIKQLGETAAVWQVDLTLTTDSDSDLTILSEAIRKECFPRQKGWYRLGSLLLKMGEFGKAQQTFETMLKRATDATEKANLYHMLGNVKYNLGEYIEAIEYFERSTEMQQTDHFSRPADLITSYSSLAAVYEKMGEHVKALRYNEKALAMSETTVSLTFNSSSNADETLSWNDETLDQRSILIQSFENTMKVLLEIHPEDDLFLASKYDRFGSAFKTLGANKEAEIFYERAFEIKRKLLSPIHPSTADTLANRADVHELNNDPTTAYMYRQQAAKIRQLSLPKNHPDNQAHEEQSS